MDDTGGGTATNGNWAAVADTSWYDSSLSTFTLNRPEQLAGLAELVNNGQVSAARAAGPVDFTGKTITLTADIDLSGKEWTPIGDSGNPFGGTFDGGGHTISNMTITQETQITRGQYGFFSFTGNATTVKNIRLTGVNIMIDDAISVNGGVINVGCVTSSNSGTVTNCEVSGSITASSPGYINVGGVIGTNGGTVTDCETSVSVTASTFGSNNNAIPYAGGLIGYTAGGTVTDCKASGSVTASNSSSYSYAVAGGLIGYYIGGVLEDCDASGRVTATATRTGYAGGLIGAIYTAAGGGIKNNTFSVSGTGQYSGVGLGGYTYDQITSRP
ncbi:MAG: hypothetical protein LBS93_08530 [Synergistaceae bacterium]|nr:hypothetical protein [Synergistaceae bacterium]